MDENKYAWVIKRKVGKIEFYFTSDPSLRWVNVVEEISSRPMSIEFATEWIKSFQNSTLPGSKILYRLVNIYNNIEIPGEMFE